MAQLTTLPHELLFHILAHLSNDSPKSILKLLSTCTQFHALLPRVPPFNPLPENYKRAPIINPILHEDFAPLFEPRDLGRGGVKHALRRLSWVNDDGARDAFLYPRASWRRIPLSATGPVATLELASQLTVYGGSSTQLEIFRTQTASRNMTMGEFFDFVVSAPMTEKTNTTGWELLMGKRAKVTRWVDLEDDYVDTFNPEQYFEDASETMAVYLSRHRGCSRGKGGKWEVSDAFWRRHGEEAEQLKRIDEASEISKRRYEEKQTQ